MTICNWIYSNFFWLRFKYLIDIFNLVVEAEVEAVYLIIMRHHFNMVAQILVHIILLEIDFIFLFIIWFFKWANIGLHFFILPHFINITLLDKLLLLLINLEVFDHHEVVEVTHDTGGILDFWRLLFFGFDVSSADILLHFLDSILLLNNNRLPDIKCIVNGLDVETVNLIPLLLRKHLCLIFLAKLLLLLLLWLLSLLRVFFDLECFEYFNDFFLSHLAFISGLKHKCFSFLASAVVAWNYVFVRKLVLNFIKSNMHPLWLLLLLLIVIMTLSFRANWVNLLKINDSLWKNDLWLWYNLVFSQLVIPTTGSSVVTNVLELKALVNTNDLLLIVDLISHFLTVWACDVVVETRVVPCMFDLLLLLEKLVSYSLEILHINIILLINFLFFCAVDSFKRILF